MKISSTAGRGKTGFRVRIWLCLLVFILLVLLIVFSTSPVPGSLLIRSLFDRKPQEPPQKLIYTEQVLASKDVQYGNPEGMCLDLYVPQYAENRCPLIVWVHGGAFVGGDKRDVTFFAEALAFNGYAVAVLNYSRAPESGYPVPVLQLGDAYNFLTSGTYIYKDQLDMQQVFFAGDSAGAHIAAQFILIQTNPEYRAAFLQKNHPSAFPEPIPGPVLKGALLYCGPYSVQRFNESSNVLLQFLVRQTSWAYFGERKISSSPAAGEIDIIQNITQDFPPTFITDGNTLSFAEHAKDLLAKLDELEVPAQSLFFDETPDKVPHEYQFELQSEAAQSALEQTLDFLRIHTQP